MDAPRIDEFPKYKDGDVSIVISTTHIYQLHSAILKRNSPYFDEELQKPGARLTSKARQEGLAAYRFELVTQTPGEIGYFERKEVTDSGRVPRSTFALPSPDSSRISEQKSQYWDWLFGSFYGKQPAFDDHNLATVLSDCMGLVDVAESVGAVDRVRELVDLALLRQDTILWQSIASNPVAWVELGRRVHSPTIFKEGIVHLVGTWPRIDDATKEDMNPDIRNLVTRKLTELEISKEAIEMRILGHYPHFLTRNAAVKPGRPSYANDIYMWMTVCFFRHWFAQAISEDRTRRASDGGYSFYLALSQGGQSYLSHKDFQQFHKYFPMSGKGCNVLEANMGVLKEDVKKFVEAIVENRCHVKREEGEGGYLTCAVVEKADLPWIVAEVEREREIEIPGVGIWGDEHEGEEEELPMGRDGKRKKRVRGTAEENGAGGENEDMEVRETQDDFFQGWGEDHLEE